ncbi:MAG: helix-turn-helix domain-containing protein [Oscillospiraceae bacterium]|jgi:transcriptional regulator with XRE-family HTH domain|nr:helix-turn-helix domain-containing protein [Oscillospiraceae bacterium]
MQFTERFNYLLNANNITAYKLSKDTGIDQTLIGRWKVGKQFPAMEKILQLADYFNVSVDYLLGRTDKPEVNK